MSQPTGICDLLSQMNWPVLLSVNLAESQGVVLHSRLLCNAISSLASPVSNRIHSGIGYWFPRLLSSMPSLGPLVMLCLPHYRHLFGCSCNLCPSPNSKVLTHAQVQLQ